MAILIIHPRDVVKRTPELGATAIIKAHNHPSGDPAPSKADIRITRAGHSSFKDMGLL